MTETKEDIIDTNKEKEVSAEIANLLRNQVKPIQNDKVTDFGNRISKEKETAEIIKNANQKFLLDVLSPEIKENEKKKREHKDTLMTAVSWFLGGQFVFVALMVGVLFYAFIKCHMNGKPFSDDTMQMCFTFVGAYITSVVVELIAILRCIVKNVFDTSIAGLVEAFREK